MVQKDPVKILRKNVEADAELLRGLNGGVKTVKSTSRHCKEE